MELIDRFKLSNGLIGFGGRPGMGLTRLTLKLANQLAKKESVLFITYQEHELQLNKLVSSFSAKKNQNLEINSSFQFFDFGAFDALKLLLQRDHITVLFIDDLNNFISEEHANDNYIKDSIISQLKKLSEELNIKIIVNLSLSNTVEHRSGDKRPMIRDFRWSRRMINDCNQIFALYRPAYYGIVENENGDSALSQIDVQCLKNSLEDTFNLVLDNKEEKILPVHYLESK